MCETTSAPTICYTGSHDVCDKLCCNNILWWCTCDVYVVSDNFCCMRWLCLVFLSVVPSDQNTGSDQCTYDDSTGLPDDGCWFYPKNDNSTVTSVMSFTYLDSVKNSMHKHTQLQYFIFLYRFIRAIRYIRVNFRGQGQLRPVIVLLWPEVRFST